MSCGGNVPAWCFYFGALLVLFPVLIRVFVVHFPGLWHSCRQSHQHQYIRAGPSFPVARKFVSSHSPKVFQSFFLCLLFNFPSSFSFILVFPVVLFLALLEVPASFLLFLASVTTPNLEVFLGCFSTLLPYLINFSHCNCWDFCFRLRVQADYSGIVKIAAISVTEKRTFSTNSDLLTAFHNFFFFFFPQCIGTSTQVTSCDQ